MIKNDVRMGYRLEIIAITGKQAQSFCEVTNNHSFFSHVKTKLCLVVGIVGLLVLTIIFKSF